FFEIALVTLALAPSRLVLAAEQSNKAAAQGKTAGPVSKGPESKCKLKSEAGALTINAQDCTIEWLADVLSRNAGLAVMMVDDVSRQTFTANLSGVRLDDGLRQILSANGVFFFYGADEGQLDQPSTLKAMRIYRQGHVAGV